MARRALDLTLILLFSLALVAPAVDAWSRPERVARIRAEGRQPAAFPARRPRLYELASWTSRLEAWFSDRLGFRDRLLELRNALLVLGFQVSPTPEIVVGRDRWIFPTDLATLDVVRGALPFSHDQLESWRAALESRRDWCRERKIEYLFALAPEKHSIYPEQLPSGFARLGPSRADQLVAHLAAHSDVRLVDLRPAVRLEKERDPPDDRVSFPLGTHWTDRGAFAGYEALLGALAPLFPGLHPLPRDKVRFERVSEPGDSWAGRLYLEGRLVQAVTYWLLPERPYRCTSGCNPGDSIQVSDGDDALLPRLFVIHDSYGDPLRTLLPYHFSHSLFEWTRQFNAPRIEAEKPDVLIELFCERILGASAAPPVPGDERVAAGPFEASSTVLILLDGTSDGSRLQARGGTRLTPREDGLGLVAVGRLDMVALPPFEIPRDRALVFAIDLTSPRDSNLNLVYRTARNPVYGRANSVDFPLRAGRQRLLAPLLEPDIVGQVLLRVVPDLGEYVLHSVEVRAVPR